MNISQLTQSRGFKQFMAKLYGIGASVVIMGALFKIIHLQYADQMLMVGLTTEAIIFFFSAFEPPHVEPDWSLVYPELAGMYYDAGSKGDDNEDFGDDKSVTQQLDDLLADAKIDGALIESLGTGLRNLSESAGNMNKLADATEANTSFVENVKNASSSVSDLASSYQKANEVLGYDIKASEQYHTNILGASTAASLLSNAYTKAADSLGRDMNSTSEFGSKIKEASQNAGQLAEEYQKSVHTMRQTSEVLNSSAADGENYYKELQRVSGNLAALNAVYELQLLSSSAHAESSASVQNSMNKFLDNLNRSIETTQQYQQGVASLAENVEALNKVYGNMLSAMNVPPRA